MAIEVSAAENQILLLLSSVSDCETGTANKMLMRMFPWPCYRSKKNADPVGKQLFSEVSLDASRCMQALLQAPDAQMNNTAYRSSRSCQEVALTRK